MAGDEINYQTPAFDAVQLSQDVRYVDDGLKGYDTYITDDEEAIETIHLKDVSVPEGRQDALDRAHLVERKKKKIPKIKTGNRTSGGSRTVFVLIAKDSPSIVGLLAMSLAVSLLGEYGLL
nr:uncharacterized protein CI109_003696 [Kwoniella shandongensis]KAA5528041.1 hypothetical protein CI109_003696 [Kwoniella shandongensis]